MIHAIKLFVWRAEFSIDWVCNLARDHDAHFGVTPAVINNPAGFPGD